MSVVNSFSSPPTMAATSVDKLVKSFKKTTIQPIYGKPMYATIHSFCKLLNKKAASISTNLRCGTLRHLCHALSPTVYATPLTTLVVPPPNPGAAPFIPVGTTRPEEASLQCSHDAATVVFNTFQNVDHALRQQLMGAVEDNLVRFLHMPHLGYSISITLYLLAHLYATYAVIANTD